MTDGVRGIGSITIPQVNERSNAKIDELTNNVQGLKKSLAGGKDTDHDAKKVKDAAQQFEGLLLHQMFQSMWQSVSSQEGSEQKGIFGGGREEEYYRDMFNEALADSVSKGQGIGIKEVIMRDLNKSIKKESQDQ